MVYSSDSEDSEADVRWKNRQLRLKLKRQDRYLDNLEALVDKGRHEKKDLQREKKEELSKVNAEVLYFKRKSDTLERQKQRATDEAFDLKKSSKGLKSQLAALKVSSKGMEEELVQVKKRSQGLEEELAKLKKSSKGLEEELVKVKKSSEVREEESKRKDASLNWMKERAKTAEANEERLRRERRDLDDIMKTLLESPPWNSRESPDKDADEKLRCGICFERVKDMVFECGHVACGACTRGIVNCHMCRVPIRNPRKIFLS